jgi:hypothetical protein
MQLVFRMISIPPLLEIFSVDSIAFARLTDCGNEAAVFLVAIHAPPGHRQQRSHWF